MAFFDDIKDWQLCTLVKANNNINVNKAGLQVVGC